MKSLYCGVKFGFECVRVVMKFIELVMMFVKEDDWLFFVGEMLFVVELCVDFGMMVFVVDVEVFFGNNV